MWSHAKSNPAALRRQSWHITQETRRYGRDLPLLAHGLISALSAAASCRSRSKACWIERGKVNTARLPVEDQFAHRLSGYRRPQNAPTIVPSRHERVREVGHASHIPISAPTPYVNTRPFLLQTSFQKKNTEPSNAQLSTARCRLDQKVVYSFSWPKAFLNRFSKFAI